MKVLRRHRGLALAAILLTPILALGVLNAFDRELTPQARALFARPSEAFSKDSGWALIYGFDAPPGVDPRAHAEAQRKKATARSQGAKPAAVANEIDVQAADEVLCQPQKDDCTRVFRARPDAVADLVADNGELLRRYDELLRARGLADNTEVLEYYVSGAYFNRVLRTQLVRLSQVGEAAGAGRNDQAIAWLEADAAFHRRWLEEAGSILTKMLAVRSVSRDLLVAGQVARSATALSPAQWDALERVAAPLSRPERATAQVVAAEARFFSEILDRMIAEPRATSQAIDSPRWVATLLSATVKRNATLNFAYPLFAEWQALDAVETPDLAARIEETRASTRRAAESDWTWAYNYAGKGFAAEAIPDLSEYVYRVRDTDALAAVVRCVISLRRAGVPRDSASDHVGRSSSCRDPYGGALQWDPVALELSFKPRARDQVKRFGGRGDRVTFAAYPAP
jgi:hypothetical protein